jgi:multidrug resistance efflux pump
MTAAQEFNEIGALAPPPTRSIQAKNISIFLLRILLFIAGLNLAIWGSRLALTRIQSVVASEAFINGRIVTITAPIDGQIMMAEGLRSGLPVDITQPIAQIINPDLDPWLRDANYEMSVERSRLSHLIQQLTQRANSLVPSREYHDYQTQQLQQQASIQLAAQGVRQAELRLQTAQEEAALAKDNLERTLPLAEQGAIPLQRAEEVSKAWTISEQQVQQATIEVENKRIELASIQQQALQLLPPQASISPDQLAIQDLQRQVNETRDRIAARETAIAQAQVDPKHLDQPLNAPFPGVVWEMLVGPEELVTAGQPMVRLLNCEQIWVDAFVSVDDLPRVQLGSKAKIKLYNGDLELSGRVETLRSRLIGVPSLGQDSAINPPNLAEKQVAQLRIEIDHPEQLTQLENSAAAFCNVGQITQVEILVN